MKRFLMALILAALPAFVLANGNVCTCTGSCNLNSATGWTGAASCTDAGGPDPGAGVDDAMVVASGGTLSINVTGTSQYKYLWIQAGGTATVTASPVVLNFDTVTAMGSGYGSNFFGIGSTNDARGTFTSSGKDLTIGWVGASSAAMMSLGPQPFSGSADLGTNYTVATLRGVVRADTYAGVYSQGVTATEADFVDCIKWPSGFSPASTPVVGDTIVFTTGKSKEFWYKVSIVGNSGECLNSCGGAACDIGIDRAATDSTPGSVAAAHTWSSMAMTASVGGPSRHGTPVDSDANGTANSSGTRPVTGDKFVVFKPVLIQGGTNPLTNGILVHFAGASVDFRYLEVSKGAGQTGCSGGGTVFWDTTAQIASAEGAAEFINLHDFASGQGAWEVSQTDRTDDQRPNMPRTYGHVYVHDADANLGTSCAGTQNMASGLTFFLDQADGVQDGITFNGLHVARWGNSSAVTLTRSGAAQRNIILNNFICHDWPGISGYGVSGACLSDNAIGPVSINGASMWDLGATSRPAVGEGNNNAPVSCAGAGNPFACCTGAGVGVGCAPTTIDTRNAFIVNIDGNAAPGGNQNVAGDVEAIEASGRSPYDTSAQVTSNSYIAKIVGGAVAGGTSRFNFVKDTNIEDDGAAPCVTGGSVFTNVVEMTGNVITRSSAIACMENAVMIYDTVNNDPLTNRTRKVVSNVFHNMFTDGATGVTCLRHIGANLTIGTDFYNNVCDMNGLTGTPDTIAIWGQSIPTSPPFKITAFYNVFEGLTDSAGGGYMKRDIAAAVFDEGYNRIMNATQSPACEGGCAGTDVDSDVEDFFVDRPNTRFGQRCDSPDKARNPWGGPVGPLRFGIQSFANFHPAVLPLMDADAFKSYDWRACGRTYQDAVCR